MDSALNTRAHNKCRNDKKESMKSRILLSLCAFLLFCAFLSLGVWQLHRAGTKRLLLKAFSIHTQKQNLQIEDLTKTNKLNDLRYFPIKITGHYDNAHHFLLDNKFYNHQLGYEVLTPFSPIGSDKFILVNRGWVPRNYVNLQNSIIIGENSTTQTIHGLIYIPLSKPFLLKQTPIINNPIWPLVVQAIQIDRLGMQLKQNLYPAIIWLDKNEPNGFVRDWHPIVMLPQQHLGYAVQWFALALTLLIIYIVLIVKKT